MYYLCAICRTLSHLSLRHQPDDLNHQNLVDDPPVEGTISPVPEPLLPHLSPRVQVMIVSFHHYALDLELFVGRRPRTDFPPTLWTLASVTVSMSHHGCCCKGQLCCISRGFFSLFFNAGDASIRFSGILPRRWRAPRRSPAPVIAAPRAVRSVNDCADV